jgi:hypothetical protein
MKKQITILIILVLCSSMVFATGEIRKYYTTGTSVCVKIVDTSNSYMWNNPTKTFMLKIADANIGLDMVEDTANNNLGLYKVNLPAEITTAKRLEFTFYNSTAAALNTTVPSIGGYDFYWTGTAEITPTVTHTLITDTNDNTKAAIAALPGQVATSIFAKTGITAGGTWTFAKILKVLTAWDVGKWQDKAGSPGIYEVLDGENGSTAIIDVDIQETSPYTTTTVH